MTYYARVDSQVGPLMLIGDESIVRGVYFMAYKRAPLICSDWIEDRKPFASAIKQLHEYLEGKRAAFDLNVHWLGTEFQKSVWEQVRAIPYGARVTYKDIARAIGRPAAVRAVGTAIGSNPLCIIGPCHRVVASDGSLGGYAGGLGSKQFLLELEQAHMAA